MKVNAVVIALPNFDERVLDWVAAGAQDPTAQVRNLADSRREAVVDDDQIVVGVERKVIRIEGAFSLPGRADQLFGEQTTNAEQRGSAESSAPKKIATRGIQLDVVHCEASPG